MLVAILFLGEAAAFQLQLTTISVPVQVSTVFSTLIEQPMSVHVRQRVLVLSMFEVATSQPNLLCMVLRQCYSTVFTVRQNWFVH